MINTFSKLAGLSKPSSFADQISTAQTDLLALEAKNDELRRKLDDALLRGDMADAEAIEAAQVANTASAGRYRQRIVVLQQAAEDAAKAEREAAIQVRIRTAREARDAGQKLLPQYEKLAADMAGILRKIAAAETFVGDVSRETGTAIDGVYAGLGTPPKFERQRRSWWEARGNDGTVHRCTNRVTGQNSDPKPRHDFEYGTDSKGNPLSAPWHLEEDTVEVKTVPALYPPTVHEETMLPTIAVGASPIWDEDNRRAASLDAEKIVREWLKR